MGYAPALSDLSVDATLRASPLKLLLRELRRYKK